MGVWFDAVGGNHDQLQGFARIGGFAEDLHFLAQLCFVVFVDDIIANWELDFADVYDMVATVDNEVDLCFAIVGASLPGWDVGEHRIDAYGFLDLSDVVFADLLEGLASPTALCRIVEEMSPEMFVGVLFAFHETKVEQGEVIGQLSVSWSVNGSKNRRRAARLNSPPLLDRIFLVIQVVAEPQTTSMMSFFKLRCGKWVFQGGFRSDEYNYIFYNSISDIFISLQFVTCFYD